MTACNVGVSLEHTDDGTPYLDITRIPADERIEKLLNRFRQIRFNSVRPVLKLKIKA